MLRGPHDRELTTHTRYVPTNTPPRAQTSVRSASSCASQVRVCDANAVLSRMRLAQQYFVQNQSSQFGVRRTIEHLCEHIGQVVISMNLRYYDLSLHLALTHDQFATRDMTSQLRRYMRFCTSMRTLLFGEMPEGFSRPDYCLRLLKAVEGIRQGALSQVGRNGDECDSGMKT